MTDVVNGTIDSYVVAGWFTPDYRHHLVGLTEDLDAAGHPYFFEAVPKDPSGWAANTRLKAPAILRAMDRHPGVKLIWLDVDCRIIGNIQSLIDINTDFAIHFKSRPMKMKHNRDVGRYRAVVQPWSGTMVLSPTLRVRKLIEAWRDAEADVLPIDTDETTLGLALARVPELKVTFLHHDYCSSPADISPNPIIQHGRGRPPEEIEADIARRNNRPIRAIKQLVISKIVGKPYSQWKKDRSGKQPK